jgi:hypothetical protein
VGQLEVESDLTAAAGTWTIIQADLNLVRKTPGGPWEIRCKLAAANK